MAAVGDRDASLAVRAADQLMGRGPGLTPFGDDLLCAAAIAVAALGPAFGWTDACRDWLTALLAPGPRVRTTALSATLLELAVAGNAIEPVHTLLDPVADDELGWRRALHRLMAIGHSTGYAYALGLAGAAARMAETHTEDRDPAESACPSR
jgi:hypothetical protein